MLQKVLLNLQFFHTPFTSSSTFAKTPGPWTLGLRGARGPDPGATGAAPAARGNGRGDRTGAHPAPGDGKLRGQITSQMGKKQVGKSWRIMENHGKHHEQS